VKAWPDPNAPRSAVDRFVAENEMPEHMPPHVFNATLTQAPFRCADCGHVHTGEALAGICIGCPCPYRGGLRPPEKSP
jgi:hypothetical protein